MTYILPPLNALRAFEAAARHLSFKLAAHELHVTPAAVGQQVKALEARLGVHLFARLHKQLIPSYTARFLRGPIAGVTLPNVAAYGVSSRIRLTGVCAARRKLEKPASRATLRRRSSPACAPRPSPTSCDSEFGVHAMADAA